MIYCKNCNAENSDEQSICSSCGNQLTAAMSNTIAATSLSFDPREFNQRRFALFAFGLPIAGAMILLLFVWMMPNSGLARWFHASGASTLFFFCFPLAIAWYLVFDRPLFATGLEARFDRFVASKESSLSSSEGKLNNWLLKPAYSGLNRIIHLTGQITDDYTRQAVKLVVLLYVFMLISIVALWVIGVVLGILLVIGSIVLLTMLGSEVSETSDSQNTSSSTMNYGESRERTDLFGDKYTEHRNDSGKVVGESRERTDFFGDEYVKTKKS